MNTFRELRFLSIHDYFLFFVLYVYRICIKIAEIYVNHYQYHIVGLV